MDISNSLKDKNILITGASSGIGAACATLFASQGAHLILCARRYDRLKKIRDELMNLFRIRIHIAAVDVTSKADVELFWGALPDDFKEVDILVNNAGLAAGLEKIHEADVLNWEKMIDTNLKGTLYMTHFFLPGMVKRNQGHIINMGSIAGHGVYPKGAVYCATKHAVRSMTQGLRMDLCGTQVKVSLVEPGLVKTEFSLVRYKGDEQAARKTYEGFRPLLPEDVANAILYCINTPSHVCIDSLLIMPLDQAGLSMVHRKNE